MKIENFTATKCDSCVGQRTKRRRIINMARNFFSSIGHKARKDEPRGIGQDDYTLPPPYESLPDLHQTQPATQPEQQEQPHIELNGREILELDSRPMIPTAQLDSVNYESRASSSDPSSNTFDTASNPALTSIGTPMTPSGGLPNQQRNLAMAPPNQMRPGNGNVRPSLAVDTHLDRYRNLPPPKFLSPSSSLRSSKSSQGVSPVTPWSSSSGSSTNWTVTSSIDTTLTSPITPSSPLGPPAVPQMGQAFVNPKDTEICPESDCTLDPLQELPGDDPFINQAIPRGLSDPLLFSFNPKDNYSWLSSVDTNLSLGTSVNVVFSDANQNPAPGPPNRPNTYPASRSLFGSAWSALQEHMSSSLAKVSQIPGNPLAQQLEAESPANVFRRGLSNLRRMLDGKDPQDPFDYICFVHIVYAFCLVIHQNDLASRCGRLFEHILARHESLGATNLDTYAQFVSTIWQPTVPSQTHGLSNAATTSKGKSPIYHGQSRGPMGDNPLLVVARNFLDGE